MTKKCLGCGIRLQDIDESKAGYTKDINMPLCMRCFKLTNYNELINKGIVIDNDKLLKRINAKKTFVIFLVDYLNLYQEVIDTYKKVECEKILVITKSDLIPSNIKKNVLVENIKRVYDIESDIYLVSSKTKENLSVLASILKNKKKVLMAGFTNAGKSSIINTLVNANITVSKKSNTTQDFIRLSVDGVTIYDAPGFISKYYLDENLPQNKVMPITYQLTSRYFLRFNNIDLYFKDDTNITMYLNKTKIMKMRLKEDVNYDIKVLANSDIIIKGLGFIKVSKDTTIGSNIDYNYLEVRPSIIGGKHEQD